ncbi:hypothetical protein F4775DRAFT_555330 [Biscogniauxia sp. FL1348]|nr:hypothetical protein F4775DRAFT_555330 [Biscogniauxia sp. FL1348]
MESCMDTCIGSSTRLISSLIYIAAYRAKDRPLLDYMGYPPLTDLCTITACLSSQIRGSDKKWLTSPERRNHPRCDYGDDLGKYHQEPL